MSIASEISRLQTAKTDIKTAIEAKGVTVPSSATIDTYDDYVSQISGGGGGDSTLIGLIERSITNFIIPNGTTKIGDYAFYYYTTLTGILTIPDSVKTISANSFQGLRNLSQIIVGSGVTTIGAQGFYGCTGLTSITINAVNPPTLSNTNAFGNTNNCPIYVPSGSVDAYKTANRWSSLASRIQAIPNS